MHFLNIWQIQIGVWIQKLWNKIFRLKYVVPTEIQVSKSAKNISLKKKKWTTFNFTTYAKTSGFSFHVSLPIIKWNIVLHNKFFKNLLLYTLVKCKLFWRCRLCTWIVEWFTFSLCKCELNIAAPLWNQSSNTTPPQTKSIHPNIYIKYL